MLEIFHYEHRFEKETYIYLYFGLNKKTRDINKNINFSSKS